ncbi:biotin/lipoyl-containing protein [uncultured Rikenella sp.]|uniref:biotin/lipoyl-containing protein n=1 Tax=uncultured Rikenella sp. TaxID=368003 RepID=UPI0026310088|nr:biotin/lipoyl-containing protein [uncultured Rikenella sp.]
MKEYKIKINGNEYAVSISNVEDSTALVNVNGTQYEVEVEGMNAPKVPKIPRIVQQPVAASAQGDAHPATARTSSPAATASASAGNIKSPLPGVVLDVMVQVGDAVKTGQRLMILEAMKMENNIDSDREGTVKEIRARKGDSVLEGDVLITIG